MPPPGPPTVLHAPFNARGSGSPKGEPFRYCPAATVYADRAFHPSTSGFGRGVSENILVNPLVHKSEHPAAVNNSLPNFSKRRRCVSGSRRAPVFPRTTASSDRAASKATSFAGHSGTVVYDIGLDAEKDSRKADLWLPYPMSGEHRKISKVAVEGNFDSVAVCRDADSEAVFLHADREKIAERPSLTFSFHVDLDDRKVENIVDSNGPVPKPVQKYLKASRFAPSDDPEIEEIAEKATEGKTGVLEKARAVYDWAVENTFRDPEVKDAGDWRKFFRGGDDLFRLVPEKNSRGAVLEPRRKGDPVNYLMHPFARVDGKTPNYFDPKAFSYSVSCKAD